MNRVTIATACATMALVVPAGWRALDADIPSDGPKMRPAQQVLDLGDTKVTLDLDRGVMLAGGKASVTLVATADHPHRVAVALRALQDMGYGRERVPNPPREVDSRTVMLDAEPGGGVPTVATFQLAKRSQKPGGYEWFDIVATSPKVKDVAAQVGLATWSGNTFAMTVEPPAQVPTEGPFTIAVRVTNTTKQAMKRPYLHVGARIAGVDGLDSELAIHMDDDYTIELARDEAASEDDSVEAPPIAPGAEYVEIYRVTPHFGIDHFTFVAFGRGDEGGAALATTTVDRPPGDEGAQAPSVISRR